MATRQPEGIVFPLNDKGERSTQDAQKKLFAEIFKTANDEQTAKQVLSERNWRFKYDKYLMKHVQQSLKSPQAAIEQSKAGLEYMHNNFEFIRDGKTFKFGEAMKTFTGSFEVGVVKGKISSLHVHITNIIQKVRRKSLLVSNSKYHTREEHLEVKN